ncbi:MAG: class I SAM-dependent methyltransferase [Flavobacteriales bacterium]|nr:class I SAM-dependent methyltransferase [Flavobacteriales bacterium]
MDTPTNQPDLSQPVGKGVRRIQLMDIVPDCEIFVNTEIYDLADICAGKDVVDIGCGFGRNRPIVESKGGRWVGVEPFEGGAHMVKGDAENLPFENETFDVAIMDAVLEHVPQVHKSFEEVARVLRPGGIFIGYVAFMECFHEISYSHLSFKAMEHYSNVNGLKLEKIQGGHRFGIDYHLNVLLHPLPFKHFRGLVAWKIRAWIKLKSKMAWIKLRFRQKKSAAEASTYADLWYKMECLRLSNGFTYIIRKPNT